MTGGAVNGCSVCSDLVPDGRGGCTQCPTGCQACTDNAGTMECTILLGQLAATPTQTASPTISNAMGAQTSSLAAQAAPWTLELSSAKPATKPKTITFGKTWIYHNLIENAVMVIPNPSLRNGDAQRAPARSPNVLYAATTPVLPAWPAEFAWGMATNLLEPTAAILLKGPSLMATEHASNALPVA